MMGAAAIDPVVQLETTGTLVCEGDVCAVVGTGSDAAVLLTAPVVFADGLDGLLRKQISDQVDQAGAMTPRSLLIKEELDGV